MSRTLLAWWFFFQTACGAVQQAGPFRTEVGCDEQRRVFATFLGQFAVAHPCTSDRVGERDDSELHEWRR